MLSSHLASQDFPVSFLFACYIVFVSLSRLVFEEYGLRNTSLRKFLRACVTVSPYLSFFLSWVDIFSQHPVFEHPQHTFFR